MPRPPRPANPYASWSALFGATVQKLRVGLRARPVVTQEELGRRIGFSGSTVSAVERGILRPDAKFVEGCERELPAGGMLQAMLAFINTEWEGWERTGIRPVAGIPPPAELSHDAMTLTADSFETATSGVFEVLEFARYAEASDLGAGTLEGIERTVDRFCRDYPITPPKLLIAKIQPRLRHIRNLLNGKVTLVQHRALLVASGWLSALLACVQFDAGDREAAEASRDAAYQFGKEAEHQEVMAWSFEILAWFALVDNRFRDVIDLSRTGLRLTSSSSAAVQLGVQEAKGWSRLGRRADADDALRRAGTALAKLPVPSNPDHHFVFDAPKLSFYASTCYVWLGEPDRAEEHASQVINLCLETPGTVRWPARLAETSVDLGLIAEQRGQVDEASAQGARALSAERKAASTLGRFAELDAALMRKYPDAAEARDLHERYMTIRQTLEQGTLS